MDAIKLNYLRKIILFFILVTIVLWANTSVINFNLMYPEQPSIYIVNQTIHHFGDSINIYLHPKLLNQNIPFFRPSGHFLLYQILTPFIGWHNTKAFFIVNFIFLAGIGYFFIEIYQRLFPNYKIGGYIGFSLYLMHPALSLARVTLMHFEFAYVFFLMWSLYLFIIFCQKNALFSEKNKFRSMLWYFFALVVYVAAVTFKEPAIMLGPVFMCYFLIYFYKNQTLRHYGFTMLKNPSSLFIMCSMTLVSLLLGLYIIASWPNLSYPTSIFKIDRTIGTIKSFIEDVWGVNVNFHRGYLAFPDLAWRTIVFPYIVRMMLWFFCALSFISAFFLFKSEQSTYKKSWLFIIISAILFLILPFAWATAGPWHYTLTLIFINLIMGFSWEHLGNICQIRKMQWYGLSLIPIIANIFLTIYVNNVNIKKYDYVDKGKIGLAVNRNAIHHPPNIKNKLTANSLIVVEDSIIHNDYLMGNAAYPYLLFLGEGDYDRVQKQQSRFFLKFQTKYSGNLFRYAYLMPNIKEQLYPFRVENMKEVPNEIIYNWLLHYDDIFCLGYDADGNWHDKTASFKQMLLKEKRERNLILNNYTQHDINKKLTHKAFEEILFYPDSKLCQYRCDQDETCKGFTYQFTKHEQHSIMKCEYTSSIYSAKEIVCSGCTWNKKIMG